MSDVIGYIWGVRGDESIPAAVTFEDLLKDPHLEGLIKEFEADMSEQAHVSYEGEDLPF